MDFDARGGVAGLKRHVIEERRPLVKNPAKAKSLDGHAAAMRLDLRLLADKNSLAKRVRHEQKNAPQARDFFTHTVPLTSANTGRRFGAIATGRR